MTWCDPQFNESECKSCQSCEDLDQYLQADQSSLSIKKKNITLWLTKEALKRLIRLQKWAGWSGSLQRAHVQRYLFSHFHTLATRASAQRVTNTPGRCHFLIIKYFKVNDNDIRQNIVYKVSLWVTLIYHPKYNFPGVNSLQDMKQICWAIKYRTNIHLTS